MSSGGGGTAVAPTVTRVFRHREDQRVLVVEVNGDRREVAAGSTVATLIEELGLHPRAVAVEYNGEILKRTAYPDTVLAPGDRLEIVRFVQGGRRRIAGSAGR